jgi:ectoine hydroxylase-related dioxygenase (phytanoyl-CoA dioxygenase family)
MQRITDEQVRTWRDDGYVIVPNLLTGDELTSAQANVRRYFPSAEEFRSTRERYPHLGATDETDQTEFPFADDALNDITVHPEILSAVERALGTEDLSLVISLVWAKYGSTRSFDQKLHADYAFGYDLLYPRDDADYQLVLTFIYYEDVTIDLGPTHVVSKKVSGDRFLYPNTRSREADPELYAHEVAVTVPAGSALMLSQSTFHRGSAMLAAEGARFAHFIGYRASRHPWIGWMSPQARQFDEPARMQRFLERATPRQRQVIGIPAPGDEYWDERTLAGVGARYPGMDMEPYRAAVGRHEAVPLR